MDAHIAKLRARETRTWEQAEPDLEELRDGALEWIEQVVEHGGLVSVDDAGDDVVVEMAPLVALAHVRDKVARTLVEFDRTVKFYASQQQSPSKRPKLSPAERARREKAYRRNWRKRKDRKEQLARWKKQGLAPVQVQVDGDLRDCLVCESCGRVSLLNSRHRHDAGCEYAAI